MHGDAETGGHGTHVALHTTYTYTRGVGVAQLLNATCLLPSHARYVLTPYSCWGTTH
jgi:hypothetical protein